MSDNELFSKEIQVVNSLRRYLIEKEYQIVQLVASGGQCSISLTFTNPDNGQRATCFPDLICFSENQVILGEVKPKFSASDKEKLMRIMRSPDGETNIFRMIKLRFPRFITKQIKYLLVHADATSPPDADLDQLVFKNDCDAIFLPSTGY